MKDFYNIYYLENNYDFQGRRLLWKVVKNISNNKDNYNIYSFSCLF